MSTIQITETGLKAWLLSNLKNLILLLLTVGLAYANSLNNGFVSDDIPAILQNSRLGQSSYIFSQPFAFLRPLFYFILNQIFGRAPVFFRLLNIFFHLGTVLAFYALLFILVNKRVALWSSLLFAVHPILTEAVTWISGGPYVQFAFFLMLSFLLYVISFRRKRLLIFSCLSFMLAVLTSEKAVVFPLILLLFLVSFRGSLRQWRSLIPFFVIGILAAAIYACGIAERLEALQATRYQKAGLLNPFIQIPVALSSYLEFIFWPGNLTLYHSEMTFTLNAYLIKLFFSFIFFVLLLFSFKQNRAVFFWLSFFIISLLPTLIPWNLSWVVAERYVYLGTCGIIASCIIAFEAMLREGKAKAVFYTLCAVAASLLLARTIARNIDWKNEDSLWLATIKLSPSSPNVHNNLGDVYSRRGEFERAAAEFLRAIELNPRYADAYHNLANTELKLGMAQEALGHYQSAIELNPRLWQSYQSLAAIYFQAGDYRLAKEMTLKALQINNYNSALHANLGIIYLRLGDKQNAINELGQAIELDRDNQIARGLLGEIKQ